MSMSIFYTLKFPQVYLDPGVIAPSCIRNSLEKCFHGLPLALTSADIPTLRRMASTISSEINPYRAIIEAIEKHGTITIDFEA